MISQGSRFSIGQQSSPASSVTAIRYASLPNSPQTTIKHEPEPQTNSKVNGGRASGRYVFIPQKDDAIKHRFRLRYSPCSDTYLREWNDRALPRFGGEIRGWEKGVYSFESVERVVDAKKNLVYLERATGCNIGILSWKMNFGSCGLVVDQVSIKVASHHLNGGEVLVMLTSDETKKTISHMEGLGLVEVNGFENSKNLVLSIHLIGDTAQQQTRLFEKNILSEGDYPLDIKVTLKPPAEMYSQPVILLGLMFSYCQETTVDRRHYRTHSSSSGRGFLHLNIVQGKNITSSKDALPDAQVKCYLLPDDRNIKSCKTGRAKKSSSPVWDEYFVIDGVAQSQLRKKQLGIRVVNWHLGINRKNSRLGEMRIGCTNAFDYQALPSPRRIQTMGEEGMVYSTLISVDEERLKRDLGPASQKHEKEANEEEKELGVLDTVFLENNQPHLDSSENSNDHHNSSINERQQNENFSTFVENLKRINDTELSNEIKNSQEDKWNNTNPNIFEPCENYSNQRDDHVATQTKGDKIEDGVRIPTKPAVVKPRRPPPPNKLKLKEEVQPDSSVTLKQHQDNENCLKPVPPRKVQTPTMSRLMPKLPLSPRRGRRLSWGGESDLSLESPRSTKSSADYDSLESLQWDFMISRPKEWIYCWQSLEVNFSE